MKKSVLFFTSLVFFVVGYAQEIKNDTTAKEIEGVLVFSSPYEAQKQLPVSYSQANAKTIRLLDHGTEPAFILQRMPGISFTTDNGTQFGYSNFRLRGIDQNRINITVNGLPLNEPEDAGTYFSNFSGLLSHASSVQLQRGIGLSKNGAPAFAGSLDFDTKNSLGNRTEFELQAGSFSTFRFHGETQQGDEKNLFTGKINLVSTDGFKHHSNNRSGSGLFQWQHNAGKTQLLYLLLAGINKNELSWLAVTDSAAKADFKSNGNSEKEDGDFSQVLQQLHIKTSINKNQSFHAGLFYNYTNGQYGFDLYNFLYIPAPGSLLEYRTRSNYLGLLLDYKITGKNFNISAGLYGSLYRKHHRGVNQPGDILLYKNYGDKNELSPFAKFIFRKNKFYFFTDLQYRFAAFSYTGDVALKDFNWNFFNPLAGAGYQLNKNIYLFASAGHIKREPGRNDIFMGNDNLAKDNNGNAQFNDLAAEKNFSVEAGVRIKKEKWEGSLSIYRMKIMNAIDLNGQIGPTGLPLHSNVAKAIRAGAELEFVYEFPRGWQFLQSLAYAPHRIIEDNKNSDPVLTPGWISFSEVQYDQNNYTLVLQGRYQSKAFIDFGNNHELPSFATFNFIAKYHLDKVVFSLRLMNITNEKTYTSGQLNVYGKPIYLVQAPFHVMGGVQIEL
ncbi:MAG: TonB-dependent receptor [Chitinophagaceae bacterium]|nr:TonB-dependent receptor [Chitinophagaceae bacterium]